MHQRLRAILCAFVLALAACGEGRDPTASDDPAVGQQVSEAIEILAGGQVALGNARLEVPANARSFDATITLAIAPRSDQTRSSIYAFGPAYVTFALPAALSIRFDAEVPPGQRAVIARQDDQGRWQDLPDAEHASGVVGVSVHRLARYAIRFVAHR